MAIAGRNAVQNVEIFFKDVNLFLSVKSTIVNVHTVMRTGGMVTLFKLHHTPTGNCKTRDAGYQAIQMNSFCTLF